LHNFTRSDRLSLRRKAKKAEKTRFFVKKFGHVIFFCYLCPRKRKKRYIVLLNSTKF